MADKMSMMAQSSEAESGNALFIFERPGFEPHSSPSVHSSFVCKERLHSCSITDDMHNITRQRAKNLYFHLVQAETSCTETCALQQENSLVLSNGNIPLLSDVMHYRDTYHD